MPKVAAKRSACDRCRAKRVRCPRPEDSTAPCPRCVRAGAPCATGSPGYPGRPRKSLLVEDDGNTPTDPAVDSGVASSHVSPSSMLQQDIGHAGLHTPTTNEPLSVNTPTAWLETDDSGQWAALSETQLFDPTSTAGTHTASAICSSLQWEQLGGAQPSLQGLLGAADSFDMTYLAEDSHTQSLGLDPARASAFACLPSPLSISHPSAACRLRGFGEKLEQQISITQAFLSDHRNMVENCPEAGPSVEMGTDNPVAALLICTKELIEIIQTLKAETSLGVLSNTFDSPHQLALPSAPTSSLTERTCSISTEIALLIISNYLALLKLYDLTFHHAYLSLSQVPPDKVRSLKAKGVLRIGGMSSLQDIPARVYAAGVLETIQSHIQALECSMGLPPKYCLSYEATVSQRSTNGMFADGERERLLHIVMAQEDVQRQRDNKPLIELIRENMKGVIALFGNEAF